MREMGPRSIPSVFRATGTVLIGNLAGSLMGFGVTLLAIRRLLPVDFGLLSLAIAVIGLLSQGMELGLTTGFVKFASQYLREQKERASLILLVAFKSRLISGLLVLASGCLLADGIGELFFRREGLGTLLRLSFIGGFGLLLFGFSQGVLQARQWFGRYSIQAILPNLLRLAALITLILIGQMSLTNILLAYILAPLACFAFSWLIIPTDFLRAKGDQRGVFWEIFHFSKWVTLSNIATMVILRLDVFMLTSMKPSEEVAFYVGANQLAYIFPILTGSITQALLPRATSLSSPEEIQSYVRGGLKLIPWAVLIFLPLVFLAGPMVELLYGDLYASSIPIFRLLIMAFMISVVINPLSLLIYTMNRAELLTLLNWVQLILNFGMNLWLIPTYGALGAAVSSLAIRALAAVYIGYIVRKMVLLERRAS